MASASEHTAALRRAGGRSAGRAASGPDGGRPSSRKSTADPRAGRHLDSGATSGCTAGAALPRTSLCPMRSTPARAAPSSKPWTRCGKTRWRPWRAWSAARPHRPVVLESREQEGVALLHAHGGMTNPPPESEPLAHEALDREAMRSGTATDAHGGHADHNGVITRQYKVDRNDLPQSCQLGPKIKIFHS